MPFFLKKRYNSQEMENYFLQQERMLLDDLAGQEGSFLDIANHRVRFLSAVKNPANAETVTDEVTQLKKIREELMMYYEFPPGECVSEKEDNEEDEEWNNFDKFESKIRESDYWCYVWHGQSYLSPRATWLIWQYKNLSRKFHDGDNQEKKPEIRSIREYLFFPASDEAVKIVDGVILAVYKWWGKTKKTIRHQFQALKEHFDIFKKIVDGIDDLWSAIGRNLFQKAIMQKITVFIVGIVTTFIHAVEGTNGLVIAYKALSREMEKATKEKTTQGKLSKATKIITGISVFLLAVAGMILGFMGMVLKNILFSSLCQILMTGIVAFTLARRVVRYFRTDIDYYEQRYEETGQAAENGKIIKIDLEKRLLFEIDERYPGTDEKWNEHKYYEKRYESTIPKTKKGTFMEKIMKKEILGNEEKIIINNNEINLEAWRNRLLFRIDEKHSETNEKWSEHRSDPETMCRNFLELLKLDHKLTRIRRLGEKYEEKKSAMGFGVLELLISFIVSAGVALSMGKLTLAGVATAFVVKVSEKLAKNSGLNDNLYTPVQNWFEANLIRPVKFWFLDNHQEEKVQVTPIPDEPKIKMSSKKIAKWLSESRPADARPLPPSASPPDPAPPLFTPPVKSTAPDAGNFDRFPRRPILVSA